MSFHTRKASSSDRFSAHDVNTIWYYFQRAPTKVLAEIYRVRAGLILRIQRGQSNSDTRMPKSFLPDPSVARKVERKTYHCVTGLALDPRHITQMKKDLRRCPLTIRARDILLRLTQGERVPRLAKEYQITRQRIYQIRKEALVLIWRNGHGSGRRAKGG